MPFARHRHARWTLIAATALLALPPAALALPGRNQVRSDDIARGNVRSSDIGNRAVSARHLRAGAVGAAAIAGGAVTSAAIADGTIGTADLANGAVTEAKIAPDAVTGSRIADGAVAATEIADGSVGAAELANGAVTGPKIATGAVDSAQLSDGGVESADLASGAVNAPAWGRVVVRTVLQSVADNTSNSANATCDAGEVAVAGGASLDAFVSDVALISSRPADSGAFFELPANGNEFDTWRASAVNPSGGTAAINVRAHVLCLQP